MRVIVGKKSDKVNETEEPNQKFQNQEQFEKTSGLFAPKTPKKVSIFLKKVLKTTLFLARP
jgi:hypothetical protein